MRKILITTSTFGEYETSPVNLLREKGFEIIFNPYKRKLEKQETLALYQKDIVGVIAGLETIDRDVIKQARGLKVISRCGVGLDNVDLRTAETAGIKVFNTPNGPTEAVAELVVGLILSLLRKISYSDRKIREGVWRKEMGTLLIGKKTGIIGFGQIGRRVGEILDKLGCRISYFDKTDLDYCGGANFMRSSLTDLLKESDIVSLHMSYSEENQGLISEKELSSMKKTAFLINTSRGGIVDEKALYSALERNDIAGAGIDVFENEPYYGELRCLDNVILTPHIGSYAKETRTSMEMESVKNLLKILGDQSAQG